MREGSDSDDIEIARLLMATAAMKTKQAVFTQLLSCLPDAVFTLLYSSPHTMAKLATRNAGLAAPIGVCSCCNLCNS